MDYFSDMNERHHNIIFKETETDNTESNLKFNIMNVIL